MSIGCFTDKQKPPQPDEINKAIGACLPLWDEMLVHLRETYRLREELKFLYGKNCGWGFRFQVKSKLLACLYPARGRFTVQVILNPAEVEAALAMNLEEAVTQAIEAATPYPEGRWLFISVESQDSLRDIIRLLDMHAKAKLVGK
jgi:hypothetical protein